MSNDIIIYRELLGIIERLKRIEALLVASKEREIKTMADLDNITAEVNENTSVVQSAITLLGNLSALITSLKNDPAALQALANQLDANSQQLAAAVVANTPAAPAP